PVLVTKHFYEQQIAPKRRFFAPPGSEYMFKQEGETMQMVLSSAEVAVDLADYRIPIETRWKAFLDSGKNQDFFGGRPVFKPRAGLGDPALISRRRDDDAAHPRPLTKLFSGCRLYRHQPSSLIHRRKREIGR